MRILFVLHQFLPRHVTGTEQYARALARGMMTRGHEVRVFAFEPLIQYEAPDRLWFERDEEVDGIPVHRISVHPMLFPNRELADYDNPLVAEMYDRFLVDRGPFDVVHVFHPRHLGVEAIDAPHRHGMPVMVNLMDFWFLCPNFLLLRSDDTLCSGPPKGGLGCIPCFAPDASLELADTLHEGELEIMVGHRPGRGDFEDTAPRRAHALVARMPWLLGALSRADAVIAPSRFLAGVFQDNGLPPERMVHVPYGLDPARFGETPAEEPDREDDLLHVGYIGSLTRHKGVHVLLQAVAATGTEGLQLHVHGSLDSQPGYSDHLPARYDDPRITFHGPFEPARLGEVLAGLDVLVVPSLWYENTPFSILEALWAGVPVIASDLGGMSEIVTPGETGWLVPAGDAEALGALLGELAADRSRLGLPGRRPPAIDDNVERFLEIYRELSGVEAG